MGYWMTLVLHMPYEGSNTFDGKVAFARAIKEKISDILISPDEEMYEDFQQTDDGTWVEIGTKYFAVYFYEDAFEISTSDDWATFFGNDSFENYGLRSYYQRVLDRLQPKDSWVGTDYVTGQGYGLEESYEVWKEWIYKEVGEIKDFDFEAVKKVHESEEGPDIIYHVPNNNLYTKK